jgi:hypothetical protein
VSHGRNGEKKSSGVSERREGERCEPERSGGTPEAARPPAGTSGNLRSVNDPEVHEKAARRTFAAEYKRRILEEADRCTETGEIGALLRREGLYSSHLVAWRRQREEGALSGLAPKKRGAKARPRNPLSKENERLRREIEKLQRRLKQAETIIEAQKKISEILGIPQPSGEND